MEILQGMKLRVGTDRVVSWAPNKFAGNHGAQFNLINNDELVDLVLAKRPNGSNVRLNRNGEILVYDEGKSQIIGNMNLPLKIEFEKLNPDPKDMATGMMWVGPFDGEYHHFCDSKFWIKNINGKRCHYKKVPKQLKSKLERFKPTGGSFVVTPWHHVVALIVPQPLPKEARSQWENMSKEERRLLQIKKAGANMLPIYICKWDKDWEIELDEPVDFNKPLSESEKKEMSSFLSQFSSNKSRSYSNDSVPSEPANVEEEFTDDDEFFNNSALDMMFTPSDETEGLI
jgi:hypothetical protein|tara:strand:+ start:514 stop:1371 length:858 start_codon:yes stop_codon:yes gene_type:complete